MTCPGCGSHTSSILFAVRDGEPCPSCGLSAAAILEITSVKASRADEALKQQTAAALEELDRWRTRALTAEQLLETIRQALAADPQD